MPITAPPSPRARRTTRALTTGMPGNRRGRRSHPCSFAKATILPEKDTVPISAPSTPSTRGNPDRAPSRTSSTAAMAPAAPPPMPLNRATPWGMAVMGTCRP